MELSTDHNRSHEPPMVRGPPVENYYFKGSTFTWMYLEFKFCNQQNRSYEGKFYLEISACQYGRQPIKNLKIKFFVRKFNKNNQSIVAYCSPLCVLYPVYSAYLYYFYYSSYDVTNFVVKLLDAIFLRTSIVTYLIPP